MRTTSKTRRTVVLVAAAALGVGAAVPSTTAGATVASARAAAARSACPAVCVSIGDVSVLEGDSGTRVLALPLTLSRPSTTAVTVTYRIHRITATPGLKAGNGVDFNDRGGKPSNITFTPLAKTGLTPVTKFVNVTVFGDTTAEPDETLRVNLSGVTGGATIARGDGTGTILDDDGTTGVRIGVADAAVVEGDAGGARNAAFVVTLSQPATGTVRLQWAVAGASAHYGTTSGGGNDFGGKASGILTFSVGRTGVTAAAKRLVVPVWPDTANEGDEQFSVSLAPLTLPSGATVTRGQGTGTILDDDGPAAPALLNAMASLGDSITRAFDACPQFGECLPESWGTGTDSAVDSQYSRLLGLNPAIAGHAFNDAVSGARMNTLNAQAAQAVSQSTDYVTIEMGANDVCTSSESTMTSVATLQTQFQQALTTLTTGRPNAEIFVASIPDIERLWEVGHDNAAARNVWGIAGICQSMLANPQSLAQADVDRRARVRQRVIDFNTALATVCAQFAHCKFDGNAVFNTQFVIGDLSTIDYFHPSIEGQSGLAALTWTVGFGW